MASKYDSYWQSKIPHIKRLLGEAYANRTGSQLDVSDIRSCGQRSWYGVVDVFKDGHVEKGEMAHARSLGHVIISSGLLAPYNCLGFRMVISNRLTLAATRLDGTGNPVSVPPAPAGNPASIPPAPPAPGSGSASLSVATDDSLWKSALADPAPLFRTTADNPLLAVFDDKGFFLSDQAQWVYDRIKSLPHIYVARFESENAYYFGISSQPGGRWKRQHAYHLGGLAYEILGTKRYDDQDHSGWVAAWFHPFQRQRRGPYHAIGMKEKVVISFLVPEPKASKAQLGQAESRLIALARARGSIVLNKRD